MESSGRIEGTINESDEQWEAKRIAEFAWVTRVAAISRSRIILQSPSVAGLTLSDSIIVCLFLFIQTLDFQCLYDVMCKPAWLFDGRLIADHRKLRKIGFHVKVIGVYINDALDQLQPSLRYD